MPEDYRDFLSKASPLRADFRLRGYHGPVTGYGAQNLIHYQRGYSYNPVEKKSIASWNKDYLVIADREAILFVLILRWKNHRSTLHCMVWASESFQKHSGNLWIS